MYFEHFFQHGGGLMGSYIFIKWARYFCTYTNAYVFLTYGFHTSYIFYQMSTLFLYVYYCICIFNIFFNMGGG